MGKHTKKQQTAYKGFNADMTCRDFQYEEGGEYETESGFKGSRGFSACDFPLKCFAHYSPSTSVYHEVEQGGEICGDSIGFFSTKITVGKRLGCAELIQAAVDFIKEKHPKRICKSVTTRKGRNVSVMSKEYSISSIEGDYNSAAVASTEESVATASGYNCASLATSPMSASIAKGDSVASIATSNCSASSATGTHAVAVTTGNLCMADIGGDDDKMGKCSFSSVAVATGDESMATMKGSYGAAVCAGVESKAVSVGYSAISASVHARSRAESTGDGCVAVDTGDKGEAISDGPHSVSVTTRCGQSFSGGLYGTAVSTGNIGTATSDGESGASVVNGMFSSAISKGDKGIAVAMGQHCSAEATNRASIAAALGAKCCAEGDTGSWIVLAEWSEDGTSVKDIKAFFVDGTIVKPNTKYYLRDGAICALADMPGDNAYAMASAEG